jgi:hypothetical protein
MALDYLDFKDILYNTVTIDEYAARMGEDADIITLTFKISSKLAAEDLVIWFERGYDFVLDASISSGELEPGVWLVFVELERRLKAPERIIKLLEDLYTLTGYELKDWEILLEGDPIKADVKSLKTQMILNPHKYRIEKEIDKEDENELLENYKIIAGLNISPKNKKYDEELEHLRSIARL